MMSSEKLEQYLAGQGIAWTVIPFPRHAALENKWEAIYGDVWRLGLRHKHEARAEDEYARQSAPEFLIVPFLGDHAGPHDLGKRGPRTAAYECRGGTELPALSAFSVLDFFVSPPDLSWTMLLTHEDYALGGPYFIRQEWLVPPTRKRGFTS
jgi:hypothetical protein